MAPSALLDPATTPEYVSSMALKGPALVIGSLSTAEDGRYQTVVESLDHREVQRQLLDRLIDNATTLPSGKFSTVHVVLAQNDYDTLAPRLSAFLSILYPAIAPLGLLHVSNLMASQKLLSELTLAGFTILSRQDEQELIAQKPSFTQGTSASLKLSTNTAAVPLPRRSKNPATKSSKHTIWTFDSPTTPPIDPESLLTPEDRARPPACEPVANGKRRKKACKNCTCGLAELEAEDLRTGKVVLLDGAEGGEAQEVAINGKHELAAAAKMSGKATSSCGSCFLGDAFRCASCPYIGLPAFKPGEKVEIDFGMDDV